MRISDWSSYVCSSDLNLSGIATIKAFDAESREVERVATDSREYSNANQEAIRYSSAFVPLIRMAILAGFTMTLVVGGRAALNGDLEIGLFSTLVYMTQRLLWPLTRLGEMLDLYQRSEEHTSELQSLMRKSYAVLCLKKKQTQQTP